MNCLDLGFILGLRAHLLVQVGLKESEVYFLFLKREGKEIKTFKRENFVWENLVGRNKRNFQQKLKIRPTKIFTKESFSEKIFAHRSVSRENNFFNG